jgi:hypothetical protein
MKSLIRDVAMAIIVLLALPLGMVGPALALPALVYGFPFILLAVVLGLVALVLRRSGRRRPAAAGRSAAAATSGSAPLAGPPLDVATPKAPPRGTLASRRELEAGRRRSRSLLDAAVVSSAPPLPGGPFRRILAILDAGDFSAAALASAAAAARRDGAELVLAGMLDYEEGRRRAIARGVAAHHPAVLKQMMAKDLENLRWRLEEFGVKARCRAVVGDPEVEGPALAREEGADVVAIIPPRPRLLRTRPEPPQWAPQAPCPVLPLAA